MFSSAAIDITTGSRVLGPIPAAAPARTARPKLTLVPLTQTGPLAGINLSPKSAREALAALTTVAERLEQKGDRRAVFCAIYARMTKLVVDRIEAGDMFLEPAWMSREVGKFCELYLNALDASFGARPAPGAAWNQADVFAGLDVTVPMQDALLGINAHINFDLALSISACIGDNRDPEMIERYRHDQDAINTVLSQALPGVIDMLDERFNCKVTRALRRNRRVRALAENLAARMFKSWRSHVWGEMTELLACETEEQRTKVRARLNRISGTIAQIISLPSLPLAALGLLRR